MGKNIFENAYFGKMYKTRDNREALYCGKTRYGHLIFIKGENYLNEVKDDGSECFSSAHHKCNYDIVSELNESDKEELKLKTLIRNFITKIGEIYCNTLCNLCNKNKDCKYKLQLINAFEKEYEEYL